ncbi:MAG: hypothetical protein RLZZ347_163 [Candidatus Parcubacteria bacterium]|jgi:ABC-type multidrug transport system fused ATPase/permease subunit
MREKIENRVVIRVGLFVLFFCAMFVVDWRVLGILLLIAMWYVETYGEAIVLVALYAVLYGHTESFTLIAGVVAGVAFLVFGATRLRARLRIRM